ncbi:MAG: glycosyltransferase family protein [Hyphomicrobium sp.]
MLRGHRKILIYSHDSFGLGHLRRCRVIAHALVDTRPNLSVLILSGSPIIGNFSFRSRVDFVRIPGVIKLRHGDYMPLSLKIGIEEILGLRASIIRHTAESFAPDVVLVDKEPWGLRGEVRDTLLMLKAKGTPLVLGLRDVMDDPAALAEEWQRKNAISALTDVYDHIWIYGLPEICDPLEGVPLPSSVRAKISYTGYLRRSVSEMGRSLLSVNPFSGQPYVLVTTGGGGDGTDVIDWVLRAYEYDPNIPYPALLVLGPFMRSTVQAAFMERVRRLDRVEAITFDANVETLMADAAGIVAMGGYNTFCEILSFDKRALIVPRLVPRMEQYIRASRAEALGLVRTLAIDDDCGAARMAEAIAALPSQPLPSEVRIPGLLEGLVVIDRVIGDWLDADVHVSARPSVATTIR